MGLGWDATIVYDTVLYQGGMLVSGVDYGYPSSIFDPDAPTQRTGFIPVLSRNAGGVFVVGGRDYNTGAVVQDLHLWRPGLGWSTIMPSRDIGEALAATFSASDGKLWVLGRSGTTVRLSRVSPWTGETETLGSWTPSGTWDKQFLAVDRDGGVILVAASRSLQRSKIAKLSLDAGNRAYATRIDQDSIPYTTSDPIVDKDEYGIIVKDESGAVTSIFRRATLRGPTGSFGLTTFLQ